MVAPDSGPQDEQHEETDMARTQLSEALDRLAEAAADVHDLTGARTDRTAGAALAGAVLDLEEAAGSSLGPVDADADVVLLRRLDRARRLLLAARAPRAAVLQPC